MELFSIARSIRFRRVSPRAISLVKEPGGRKGEGGSGIRRKGTVVPALFSEKGKKVPGTRRLVPTQRSHAEGTRNK